MDTTLLVAVLGVILSVASLVWQAATYLLEGPRVKVELRVGAASFSGGYAHQPVKPGWQRGLAEMAAQGMTQGLLVVLVRNIGRHPTSVLRYSGVTDGGVKFGLTSAPPGCPSLPHRLEPHSEALFYLELADAHAVVDATAATAKRARAIRIEVELGNGRTVTTKEKLLASELVI